MSITCAILLGVSQHNISPEKLSQKIITGFPDYKSFDKLYGGVYISKK